MHRQLPLLLATCAALVACATTREDGAAAAAAPATTGAWSWDGCSQETRDVLLIKCEARRTSLALARVRSDGPPDDDALFQVELDAIGGSVQALEPSLADSFASAVEKVKLGGGDEYVWHQRYLLPHDGKRGNTAIHALALPYEESGAHFALVYSCVSSKSRHCLAALTSLVQQGLPDL